MIITYTVQDDQLCTNQPTDQVEIRICDSLAYYLSETFFRT